MTTLFALPEVPVLQNRVYAGADEARAAPTGELEIVYDPARDFAVNARFDSALMRYDAHYNNDVPSATFEQYLGRVADALVARYGLDAPDGKVIEIGCGDGRFLGLLAARCPDLTATGVDPSYTGPGVSHDGRVHIMTDTFQRAHVAEGASLIVCRHTLEHIADPDAFVSEIAGASPDGIPVYFEVPALEWILDEGAFWDLCYEHCNYFTATGLAGLLERTGYSNATVERVFSDQYLGAHAVTGAGGSDTGAEPVGLATDRLAAMRAAYDRVLDGIGELARQGDVVIWGMATKGVMLSLGLAERGIDIAGWVDINTAKQGCYTPVTARRIDAPESLAGRTVQIVCMNPNYMAEVAAQAASLGVSGEVFAPDLSERVTIQPPPVA